MNKLASLAKQLMRVPCKDKVTGATPVIGYIFFFFDFVQFLQINLKFLKVIKIYNNFKKNNIFLLIKIINICLKIYRYYYLNDRLL